MLGLKFKVLGGFRFWFCRVHPNFNTLKLKYKTDTLSKIDVEKIVKQIEPEVDLIEGQKHEETANIKNDILRIMSYPNV